MQMSAELKKEIKVRVGYVSVSSRDDAMELHRMRGDGIFD
jgi:hypothetical protein